MLTLPRERMLPYARVRRDWYSGVAQPHARLSEYPEVQAIWTGWEWVGPEDIMSPRVFREYSEKTLNVLFDNVHANTVKRQQMIVANRTVPDTFFVTPVRDIPDWREILSGPSEFDVLIPGEETGWVIREAGSGDDGPV